MFTQGWHATTESLVGDAYGWVDTASVDAEAALVKSCRVDGFSSIGFTIHQGYPMKFVFSAVLAHGPLSLAFRLELAKPPEPPAGVPSLPPPAGLAN